MKYKIYTTVQKFVDGKSFFMFKKWFRINCKFCNIIEYYYTLK